MGKLIDLTGKQFNYWIVIEKSKLKKKAGAYWVCKCKCGSVKEILGKALTDNRSKSCGCYQWEDKDITGNKYEMLTVIAIGELKNNKQYYVCQCECGNTTEYRKDRLTGNEVSCCGCTKDRKRPKKVEFHGLSKTKEYHTWNNIIRRCEDTKHRFYKYYGGRGIQVCKEWKESFAKFYEDMGEKPGPEYSIERIDNNGNYCKENCKWILKNEQGKNKSNNVFITYKGKTQTITEWSKESGLSRFTLSTRLKKGLTEEDLFAPNKNLSIKGGESKNPEYTVWTAIKQKCYNENSPDYKNYGDRGIYCCERWLNSFDNFLLDMGERPGPEYSLGRINNDGPYSPENCRWETKYQQANNKTNSCLVEYNGETHTLTEWSRILDIPYNTLHTRYYLGFTGSKLLEKV